MVDLFKKPEIELKNIEWHVKIYKDKITIEHRKTAQKIEIENITDLKSLLSLIGSAIAGA